ncbi:hypothetical protein AS594_36575 [Streptomyces agglomeratus]|uniref:Uncharacterized protein n=1 Tax=Streptomyces agglomeratus TaxID=285458 RepID=A0A1E5NXL0_9ACTN|nr:hypothetical protein [Streptomyces agglomeratus]OEJ20992.1 hypothetical protein AS594_40130 [Streptomyces agglomeratus]OEJ29103.1 hypothetical protein AS594_36575 [Streptomyces agglomeratus]
MSDEAAAALRGDIDLAMSYLMGAMHGIADRYRELGSGTGRGFGPDAEYRENRIPTGKPLQALAEVLAAEAADIAARCAALDVQRAALKQLEDENLRRRAFAAAHD